MKAEIILIIQHLAHLIHVFQTDGHYSIVWEHNGSMKGFHTTMSLNKALLSAERITEQVRS